MAAFRQPALVLLAVFVGLALAVGIDIARTGGPQPWLARHGLSLGEGAAGDGERIDIGGRSLYIDCRGKGSPTVVLEAGMGDGVAGWAPVIDAIATSTRTCAYDRAGRGRSDGRERHSVADATDDLVALLDSAGERPPYVVVGHSLGEVYARVLAARHRSAVAGLVLVDGFSVDLEADWIHPLLGDLRTEYERQAQGFRDQIAAVEQLDWPASEAQLRAADTAGLPIVVLRAPRVEPRLDDATNATIAEAWEDAYATLSPGHVSYRIAWGAGHVVQADRPDLVIAAAIDVVDLVRRSGEGTVPR
jgi:pimeloyl-ACP methyl ester carboxylesterase